MSKKETNKQVAQLTAAITDYFKRATELEEQRAKADERRAKADERRAKEAQKLDEKRAKEAKELDEKRAKAADKRAAEAAEDMKNLGKKIEETTKQVQEVTRQMEETNIRYGSTTRNIGRVTEEKFFRALESDKHIGNTTFESVECNKHCKDGKPNGHSAELDIVMHNGTYSLIIEVKYLCHLNDVKKFEEKMRTAYTYISKEFNNRTLLFGMAANTFNKNAVDYAQQHGMILFYPDGQKVRVDADACTLVNPKTPAGGTG